MNRIGENLIVDGKSYTIYNSKFNRGECHRCVGNNNTPLCDKIAIADNEYCVDNNIIYCTTESIDYIELLQKEITFLKSKLNNIQSIISQSNE